MRQEPGFAGLFFFALTSRARCCERLYNFSASVLFRYGVSRAPVSPPGADLPHRKQCGIARNRCGMPSTWITRNKRGCSARGSYPVSARKKMRGCLVTYRHSETQQLENCDDAGVMFKEM